MYYNAFMALPEEDRQQAYISLEDFNTITAERDSYKTENEALRKQAQELVESEKKTKELNFTLARKHSIRLPPGLRGWVNLKYLTRGKINGL